VPLEDKLLSITISMGGPPPSEMGGGSAYTKAEANYRPSTDSIEKCGSCYHYDHNSCDIVLGKIDSERVCDHWRRVGRG
jgi:hypothetical protein